MFYVPVFGPAIRVIGFILYDSAFVGSHGACRGTFDVWQRQLLARYQNRARGCAADIGQVHPGLTPGSGLHTDRRIAEGKIGYSNMLLL